MIRLIRRFRRTLQFVRTAVVEAVEVERPFVAAVDLHRHQGRDRAAGPVDTLADGVRVVVGSPCTAAGAGGVRQAQVGLRRSHHPAPPNVFAAGAFAQHDGVRCTVGRTQDRRGFRERGHHPFRACRINDRAEIVVDGDVHPFDHEVVATGADLTLLRSDFGFILRAILNGRARAIEDFQMLLHGRRIRDRHTGVGRRPPPIFVEVEIHIADQVRLLEERQDVRRPTPLRQRGTLGMGEFAMGALVVVDPERDLLEIVLAAHPRRRRTDFLNRWQQ